MTTMHNSRVHFYTCAIPGENFDFGESLSANGKKNAEKAIEMISSWIREKNFIHAQGA
jgi:Ni,Fe-hydrogenase maturation factor